MKLATVVARYGRVAADRSVPFLKDAGGALVRRIRAIKPLTASLGLLVVVLFAIYLALLAAIRPVEIGFESSVDALREHIANGRVVNATFYDEDARVMVMRDDALRFWTAYPRSDAQTAELMDSLLESGARVLVDQQTGKAQTRFVAQFLMPLIILASLFGLFFMLMAGKGGVAEFANFSRLAGRRKDGAGDQITFADVAAAKEAKIELQEVVDYLGDPTRFAALGALAPKGVLLAGPPGTGKTLLARAVAGEAGVPFFSLSGSEFVESLVGVGAARVRDLFRQAREAAPAIVFIDELDAAGRQRGAGMGQGNDEREQTLNQMLVEMDGFSVTSGVVILGATNRPDILDPALLRPGRFDRQVVVDAPDIDGRTEILQLHARRRPLGEEVDLHRVAKQCPGFTGADLANLVNEASLLAVRARRTAIAQADLEEAIDRVVAGPERRSHVLTAEERRIVAYHEAGHAVTAAAIGMSTGVQKLSIIARGRSLGHTTTYAISDRLVLARSDLHRRLVTTLGGVAVEQLVFGEVTTSSQGDLRSASDLARSMVATYGMGKALGRVAVAKAAGEVFLGRDFTQMQQVSPATLEAVDGEIRELLEQAEHAAAEALRANRARVEEIAALLLEHETLSGVPLEDILGRVKPAKTPAHALPRSRARRRATERVVLP
ncbi:MAG TPA: ATP-dependent zinc metalloprotease FtsH [Actinomycetota bacterium]